MAAARDVVTKTQTPRTPAARVRTTSDLAVTKITRPSGPVRRADYAATSPIGSRSWPEPQGRSGGGLVSLEGAVEGGAVDVESVGDVIGVHAGIE